MQFLISFYLGVINLNLISITVNIYLENVRPCQHNSILNTNNKRFKIKSVDKYSTILIIDCQVGKSGLKKEFGKKDEDRGTCRAAN